MAALIFTKHCPGSNSFQWPVNAIPQNNLSDIPADFLRKTELDFPDVAEVEVVRHFTELSHLAYGVDDGPYLLGSCTMKYNPKVNEWAARLPGFAALHPYQPEATVQGALALMYDTAQMLTEIGCMAEFSLQPAAGAQGEMAGIAIIKAYHAKRGDLKRTKILVPESAHGTNPATAHVVGFDVVPVKSTADFLVDLDDLRAKMDDTVAGLMLTNPNTLGLFEKQVKEFATIVHDGGGLLYYDGANLNAIMGIARPGDMGFDVVHYNLHKTFSTPHGGGGPGSGPVGVKDFLVEFLPVPVVVKKGETLAFDYDRPYSIGKLHGFYGNFGVVVKAYAYLKSLGGEGLLNASQMAVLNANYLRVGLAQDYDIPANTMCMHEFVATPKASWQKDSHITTMDIAKRLLDFNCHPPTVYFPLIVHEAMMFEPTETENLARLDSLIATMQQIAQECANDPEKVKAAPHHTAIHRLDEVGAARNPIIKA